MSDSPRSWFTAPLLETEEATERARTLWRVLWTSVAVGVAFLTVLVALRPPTLVRRLESAAALIVVGGVAHAINRAGRTRLASWLFLFGVMTLLAWRAYTSGGLSAPMSSGFVTVVLLAGLLLGTRAGLVVGAACVLVGLAMLAAELRGELPPPQIELTPIALWVFSGIWIALAIVVQDQISRSLGGALRRAEEELRHREQARLQLQASFDALRVSEDKFSRVFTAVPAGLSVSTFAEGRYLDVNDAFLRLVGAPSAEAVLGRTTVDLGIFAAEDRDRLTQRLVEGKLTALAIPARRLDGTPFTAQIAASTYEFDGRSLAFASIEDVTDRLRAEEERLKAEHLYREVVEGESATSSSR